MKAQKAEHCKHCGYDGPPSKKDGVLYCGACGQRVGDDIFDKLAKLFALKKETKPKKRRHHHHIVKKKGVSFMKAFLIGQGIVTAFVLVVYFLNSPYQENMNGFLTGLEWLWAGGLVINLIIAMAVNQCTQPIMDDEEEVDCWEDHSDDE